MASNTLRSYGVCHVRRLLEHSRNCPKIPSRCYSQVIRRSRAQTPSICEGEAGICGSSSFWLRDTPSAQIINSIPNLSKNNVVFSFSRAYSCISLKKDFLSSENFELCRSFHVKTNEIENGKKKDSSYGRRKTKSQHNARFSTLYKCIFFASSAVTFTFVSFALADWWKAFISQVTNAVQSIDDPDMKIALNDHSVLRGLIIAANLAVFLMWRIPSLSTNMANFTTIGISSGLSSSFVPMMLSMFSHTSFLHFFLNMYVMMSFVKAWEHYADTYRHTIPKGMMSADKLLAFYLSAGFVANAGSLIVKHIGKLAIPSLGASGAILGLVGYMCCNLPNSVLSVAFIPNFTFSAKSGMIGIAVFDTVGLLVGIATKWRYQVFDHAAHLSGLLFGIWYAKHGEALLYAWTEYVRTKLREFRKR